MAYKAPLPMRIFHYVLWAATLFVVAWFFIIPVFLRVTAPEQTQPQNSVPGASSTNTPGSDDLMPTPNPAKTVVTP